MMAIKVVYYVSFNDQLLAPCLRTPSTTVLEIVIVYFLHTSTHALYAILFSLNLNHFRNPLNLTLAPPPNAKTPPKVLIPTPDLIQNLTPPLPPRKDKENVLTSQFLPDFWSPQEETNIHTPQAEDPLFPQPHLCYTSKSHISHRTSNPSKGDNKQQ